MENVTIMMNNRFVKLLLGVALVIFMGLIGGLNIIIGLYVHIFVFLEDNITGVIMCSLGIAMLLASVVTWLIVTGKIPMRLRTKESMEDMSICVSK